MPLWLAVALLGGACSDRALDSTGATGSGSANTSHGSTGAESSGSGGDEDSSSSGGSGTSTSSAPPTSSGTTASTSTDATGGSSSDSGGGEGFIHPPDGGGCAQALAPGTDPSLCSLCDPFVQDCPDDTKCVPADSGGYWTTACVPLDPEPSAVGEPCTLDETSAEDDCSLGAVCWGADAGGRRCVALCEGTPDAPECVPPGTICALLNNAWAPVCLPSCDPLLQDCAPDEACDEVSTGFVCVPAPNEAGGPGEPCDDVCLAGSTCISGDAVPGCSSEGCCAEFCDLALADADTACSLLDQGARCTALYSLPSPYENVGVCALP